MHAKSQDSRRLIARIAGDRKMGPAAGAFSLLMDRCRARPELGMAPLPRLLLRDLGRGTRLLIFLLLPRCWSGGDRTTLSPARRKIRLVVTAQQQQKIRAARGAWAARGGPAGCADQASAHPQLVKSNQSDVGALVSIRPSSHVAQSSQAPQGCCAVLLGGCRSCCPRRVLQPPFFSSFFFFPLLFPAPQPDTTLPAGVRCVLDSTTTCEPCIAVVERAIHKVGGDRFFFFFFFSSSHRSLGVHFCSAHSIASTVAGPAPFPLPFFSFARLLVACKRKDCFGETDGFPSARLLFVCNTTADRPSIRKQLRLCHRPILQVSVVFQLDVAPWLK